MSILYKRRCVICDNEFAVKFPSIRSKTCSPKCKGELITRKKTHSHNILCATCREEFPVPPASRRIYCSLFCFRNRNGSQKERKGKRVRYEKIYNQEHAEERKVYFHNYYEENKENIKLKNNNLRALRRAIKLTGSGELIDIVGLYKRDQGSCGICGGHVEWSDKSMDHIVPITRGGSHTWGNVQLAHINCNRRRNDGLLPGQLRLNLPNRKRQSNYKLSSYDVVVIRQRRKPVPELAEEFGVAIRTIYDVLQGRSWVQEVEYA